MSLPASSTAGLQVRSIRVTPPVGEFSDVEPGMVFVIPFVIHNVSNSVKRVRFGPPKTNAFRLINTQQSIAPGMKQVVEVEFTSKEIKEFHDTLIVRTEEGEIVIPLHAWFPAPNLVYDPVIDLGRVSAQHPVESQKVKIRNIGKKDGIFKFIIDPQLHLSLTPQAGVVPAGQEIEVAVHYFAAEVGQFRGVVNLMVEGESAPRRLEVVADIVESRVALLNPQTMEPLSRVSFDKLFFGQDRKILVLLQNYGQHTISFTIRPPDDASSPAEDETHQSSMPFECTPSEGRVQGNDSCLLTFAFSPTIFESVRGWEHTTTKGEDASRSWDVSFTVEILETEQKLDLQLVGKALTTEVHLSESTFHFPECPVNDHRDVLFTFSNESSELPISFSLDRAAHFRCEPTHGRVVPKGQQNILLTFHPNQLGAFRATINLRVNNGTKVYPVVAVGRAVSIGAKPPLVGGVDKIKEDFALQRKFARPATEAPLKFLVPQPPSENEMMGDTGGTTEWAPGTGTDLMLMSEWQQKKDHNRLYSNFVTNCRNIREYNERVKKGMVVYSNPDDIGMVPGEGLVEPSLKISKKEDPLPWAGVSADADAKKGDPSMALRKALKVDENKTVKKKFPKEPTTLNIMRECKLGLSPKDIQNIIIPVKVLDFQQVNVFSTNTKSFFVYNGLKTHIMVHIPLNIRDELARSTPSSQVIPPGQMAGFDIVFRSETVQTFQQAIYFTINETHKLKFLVFAEAIPVELTLSHHELVFRFPEFGFDPMVTLPLTLTNPGNSVAEFQWTFPEGDTGAFSFNPSTAAVPPTSSLSVDVTYIPIIASNETSCQAALKVRGGVLTKSLKLTGSVANASCTWNVKENRLDFKKVPVGATRTQVITLKNSQMSSAVYSFDTSQLSSCITVNPTRGRISPGASEDVQVILRPTSPQIFKLSLICHIRGMRQLLKLLLQAEAKIPEFYISEPVETPAGNSQVVFGGVYVGTSEVRRIVIESHDDVTATFFVDLSAFPVLTLLDGEKRPIENVATDDEEPAQGSAGQILLYQPKVTDDELDNGRRRMEEDDSEGRTSKGNVYRVSVCARQTLSFFLCFTPLSVGVIEPFVLPMQLAGSGIVSSSLRPVIVSAEGKKPRLVLTPTLVDFGSRVVVRDGTSKSPNRLLVKLCNETDNDLLWELDTKIAEQLGDVFRVEPTTGRLQPGQASQVQFTFTPLEVRCYNARYAVYLDANHDQKYMDIQVKGFGSNPALTFDRKEIILPPVPLDVPARCTFFIGNEGYESLDLRYKIAGEGKLPVSLVFSEGQTITSNHTQLPVEVHFASKRPITFTVNVDFLDDADGIFSIPVTCCADNSLLTTYNFFKWREPACAIAAEGDRKPLLLRYNDDMPYEKDTPRGPKSDSASLVSGGGHDEATSIFHVLDLSLKKTLTKRALERLKLWLNINVLPEPIDDLLAALQSNHGRLLFEVIELLTGKAPPGSKGEKGGGGKKDTAIQLCEHLDQTLLYLKQYGACVCEVRSEYLLRYDDYSRLIESQAQSVRASTMSTGASTKGAVRPQRLSERRFFFRAMHAWSTVVSQVIRVFYFSRITWRAFRGMPADSVMASYAQAEKWNVSSQDPSCVGSNIYSVPEALLLKWLSIHLTSCFSQKTEKEGRPKKGESESGFLRVCNFEHDVRDSRAFAACIMSYIPVLAPRFDPSKDTGIVLNPTTGSDLDHNATILLDAMREYGMEMRVSSREFLDFSARDFLLFTGYLYHTLPQYVPKTTIKFKGRLLEKITKQIELTNPTKWAIDYTVTLDGSEEFKLLENKFHLEPRGTGSFAIQVQPRFTRKVESRVMFLSGRSGTLSATTMVFALETEVEPDSSIKTFTDIEGSQYEVLHYEVMVENPFAYAGHFAIQVQQEYLREEKAKPFPEEESLQLFPEAFWSQSDTLALKKNDKAKYVLQFLPCVRGSYRARVVFRDEKIGEFAYAFYAKCTPPKQFDVVTIQTEGTASVTKEVTIPLRHVALEKAIAQKEERFKFLKAGRKAQKETLDLEDREINYRVEFLNEKFVGPHPFFAGPKTFFLKPPVVEDDGEGEKQKKRVQKPGDKGGLQQSFNFSFTPKGPGIYNGFMLLSSNWDVRVIAIEARSRSPGLKAELEFSCPARQQIVQEIPITNNSDKEWVIAAALQGEYFSGPREIRVPPSKSKGYPLQFNPLWMCHGAGQLVLRNNDTQEKYTFMLKSHADEPLAENTITVECKARESRKITINVPNIAFDEITYNVETDLPFVAGDPRLAVGKSEVGHYTLLIQPQLSGKATGSITFIAPNKQYIWYVLHLTVLRPPPEDTITIVGEVRKGAVCEIAISNPSDKVVDFTVRRRGEGLHGDDILTLEPRQQNAIYQLAFAPTKAGEFDGMVSFNNDDLGEFWYTLNLQAKDAEPMPLNFQCELGKSASSEILLENMTEYECAMVVNNSNEVNFSVTPSSLVLKPHSALKALATYMPSAIQVLQEGTIRISHPKAGMWEYNCQGLGLPPTKMETINCVSNINRTTSASVNFRNPFPVPKRFLATLRSSPENAEVFQLMSKKQTASLGPSQIMQIAIGYTPLSVQVHHASVVVQLIDQVESELKWEFPIWGTAEVFIDHPVKLNCKCRKETSQVFAFPLLEAGTEITNEEFTAELLVSRETDYRQAVVSSTVVSPAARDEYSGTSALYRTVDELPEECRFYRFQFAPLRPFSASAELYLRKASGGAWRYPIILEASPPDVDDVIVIEAAVNVVESVTFSLFNVLPIAKPFMAFFTPDSPPEFTVTPNRGTLPPMPANIQEVSAGGQPITVSFTSAQYGKTLIGVLVVETNEMHWRYEVQGTLPKYHPPVHVGAKVVSRLRPELEARLGRDRGKRPSLK